MFILATFVLLRVRNGFCGGTSEQPPSITRISGVGKSGIVHRSMSPCSSKHRHRLQTFPDSSGDYSLPQTKNLFFMYSNSGIPNEFSVCTLKFRRKIVFLKRKTTKFSACGGLNGKNKQYNPTFQYKYQYINHLLVKSPRSGEIF